MAVITFFEALNFLEAPKKLFAHVDVGEKKPEGLVSTTHKVDITHEAGLENVATKPDITKLTMVLERDIARLEVRVLLGLFVFTGILFVIA